MGIEAGTKHNVGLTHKSVESWVRKASAGDELRAGKGLYLRKTAGGSFWVFRYLSPTTGIQVRAQLWADDARGLIGFPDATLDEASRRAADLRAAVADGIDPVARAVEARAAAVRAADFARLELEAQMRAAADATAAAERRLTVRELFEKWRRVALTPHVRADGTRTGRKDGGQWVFESFERRLFPTLGDVAAEAVRKKDLMDVLDECKAGGQLRTANALLASLKQMFRFALVREIIDRNPLDTVTKADVGGKEVERERVLTTDELRALAGALPFARMGPRSEAAVWLILATACRVGEAMAARWDDVDLQGNTWHLPDTKNERPHTIHVSAFAHQQFAVLQGLREVTTDGALSPWLFPATDSRNHVDIKTFGKQLADRQREPAARMSGRSKNTQALVLVGGKWTPHDLRRTAATLMAGASISTDVIDECLNHKLQSKVARVYIKDRRLPDQARAFDALGAKLDNIINGSSLPSNVIALQAA